LEFILSSLAATSDE
jgi:hypothetical protein